MRVPAADPFDDDAVRPFVVESLEPPRVIGTADPIRIKATPYAWRDPASIPPRRWLIGQLLLRGTAAAAIAASGIGKTTWFVSMMLSLATGRDLLGKAVREGPQTVWYWNLEDDADELSRAIQGAAISHGIAPSELAGRLFVDSSMEGKALCTAVADARGFRILTPIIDAVVNELMARSIDLLIIDPFISSHAVDENSNPQIDAIAKEWARVAKRCACSIVLVHHRRKSGEDKTTAESSRGASGLVDACRSALVFNRMDPGEAASFGIESDDERRRYFTVHDDKHSRAPAAKADWFRLESVDLGNGDSVGVARAWSPPDAFEGVKPDDLYRVQLAIAEGEWRKDPQAAAWAGKAVATVLGLSADKKADRARISNLLRTWIENGALATVTRKDAKRQPRQFIEVERWQTDNPATPAKGGAGQGLAVVHSTCLTTTPPMGGGVGGAWQLEDAPPGHGHLREDGE